MKKKELKDWHQKSDKELQEAILRFKEEIVKMNTDLKAGKLKDTQSVNKKRHDLARLKTIIRERELKKGV